MMTALDLATSRRAVHVILLLLLTVPSHALASDSPISNIKFRNGSPDAKVQDRAERKLAAEPAPEPSAPGNASAPSPSNPQPPPPPPSSRPALISPSGSTPGPDLPPRILSPPPASEAPAIPAASRISLVAVLVGITLGVVVILLVCWSAAVYLKPEWLPHGRSRSSQLIQYERHVPT